MILILEFIFFVFGVYAIYTSRIPSYLVGGGKYRIEGPKVRRLGLLLVCPIPLFMFLGFLLGPLLGETAVGLLSLFEYVFVLGLAIYTIIIVYRIRVPLDQKNA